MVNKVILVGRLGKDPEVKYLGDGTAVANFSVATEEVWKKDGEKKSKTEWHRIVCCGRLAEICQEYLMKGSLIYLEGSNQTRSWDDNGTRKYITEVKMNTMKMLSYENKEHRESSVPEDDIPF